MIKKIPHAELKVMKFIWGVNDTVTSKQVIESMEKKYSWKQTTTLTLLSRLVKKQFLSAEKLDRYTHYTIIVKEDDYLKFETLDFLNVLHDNSIVSLVSSINEKKVEDKELDLIYDCFNNYFDNLKGK
ncbi:BlaI/MecI/CopY family transcriptional regulator [Clostridioides sp. ES-S-0108-01]|uniref:BlaI/MecI/CopY family transcriptional regulator n=1 Tax=unclassified Clostridioides TaxID=2635829 RepID=UPI001D0C4D63|nr:BlaI/MecI/CopY family transcriptional regulator [Clostridioides sp. ES-S-0107-01]MCC0785085.1 BlaI/MecI/CopY family transcriptional regulator [Clostridioides sp. ES-S-0108-01]UDN53132.1 BlaI/MecI/CopY family transcriptional regulator [Clostridioides sp. ES-S-0107-01]